MASLLSATDFVIHGPFHGPKGFVHSKRCSNPEALNPKGVGLATCHQTPLESNQTFARSESLQVAVQGAPLNP